MGRVVSRSADDREIDVRVALPYGRASDTTNQETILPKIAAPAELKLISRERVAEH